MDKSERGTHERAEQAADTIIDTTLLTVEDVGICERVSETTWCNVAATEKAEEHQVGARSRNCGTQLVRERRKMWTRRRRETDECDVGSKWRKDDEAESSGKLQAVPRRARETE